MFMSQLLYASENFPKIVPLKLIEYGVYGDLLKMYPKPYSIYLRGTIASAGHLEGVRSIRRFLGDIVVGEEEFLPKTTPTLTIQE